MSSTAFALDAREEHLQMSRRPLAFLLAAVTLLAGVLGATSLGAPATASAAPPQCLTNLVANVFAGNPTVLPAAPCSDPDHDALTIILVSGPSHGTLTAQAADGTRTYTADALYRGSDVVQFKANDGSSDSAVSTLTINVQPPPDGTQDLAPPVAQPVPPASNSVISRRCVGHGPRHLQNGLMAAEEFGYPLRVFRSDGRGSERALTHPYHRQDARPSWSPNGRTVAFDRHVQGVYEVWTVDVASHRERRIVSAGSYPAWSPDGRWILFNSTAGVSAVHPDGSGERIIIESPGTPRDAAHIYGFGGASWSRNGRCLAGSSDLGGIVIAISDSRGGSPQVIFRYAPRFSGDQGAAPSWSADGRYLLVVAGLSSSRHGTSLVRVNVDGTGSRVMTRFHDIRHAVYSPDGRTIAFSRRTVKNGAFTRSGGVYTMPAAGGRSRLAVPLRYAAAWGPRRR
jgi:hypothetical protein